MEENRQQGLFEGKPWEVMVKMCVPSVISILVMVIYNMADIYFVSRLDDPMMVAGLHVSTPIFNIIAALGTLIGGGASAAIGNALGRGNEKQGKAISSFAFWTAGAVGVVYAAVILLGMKPILAFAGAKEGSFQYAVSYLRILAISAPILLIPAAMGNMIRAEGSAKESMQGHLIGTVVNMILDPILIVTLGWGVAGAAIATVIANGCSLGYYIWYFRRKTRMLSIHLKYFTLSNGIPGRVVTLGMPTAMNTMINSVCSVMANHILSRHGELVIAAMSVTGKTTMVVSMLQMGITMGIGPVLAYHYGARNVDALRGYLRRCGLTTAVVGSCLTGICLAAGSSVVRLFLSDPELVEMGSRFLRISLIAGPVTGLVQLSTSCMQSTEKPLWALLLSMTRDGLVYLPMLYLLDGIFGLEGYVWARPVTTVLTAAAGVALIVLRLRQLSKERTAKVELSENRNKTETSVW